jgi:hypothetical protein
MKKMYNHAQLCQTNRKPKQQDAVDSAAQVLRDGKPYYMGGSAFDPKTKEAAKSNYITEASCAVQARDYSAAQGQAEPMPGVGYRTLV